MHYGISDTLRLDEAQCVIVGVFPSEPLTPELHTLDKTHHGLIQRLIQRLDQPGQILSQADIDGQSLLLLHCGDKKDFSFQTVDRGLSDIFSMLQKQSISSIKIAMPLLANGTTNAYLEKMLLRVDALTYQYLDFKSTTKTASTIESIIFYLPGSTKAALTTAEAIATGMRFTRNLANAPANVCTPTYLAAQATQLAKEHPLLHTRIFDKQAITDMNMGMFLAVAQGSHEPPQLIEISYQGAKDTKEQPIVLVGKGVTFDAGGISLKPADGMNEMKYDMAGAASVLGTLKACALLELPINVIGLVPATENMPGGGAIKPGDIVTSMSGQTVEIINTDAEGRLILGDVFTYAERFNPRFVIDIATLTGAIIIALGHSNTGMMSNNEELVAKIMKASTTSDDKVWPMPLEEAYQEALDSPIADMINASFDRVAGSITAACFLSRFAKKFPWAHLDVAGTAWISGKKRQATGRPVPLLIQVLRDAANTR